MSSPHDPVAAPPIQAAIDAAVEAAMNQVKPRLDRLERNAASLSRLLQAELGAFADTLLALEMLETRVRPDQTRARLVDLRERTEALQRQAQEIVA